MKITILGAGSIGLFVGGKLIEIGADVDFIGTQTNSGKIEKHGLTISSYKGWKRSFRPAELRYHTAISEAITSDVLLVTVKNTQTLDALSRIRNYIPKSCVILSLQNGVGKAELMSSVLPENQIVDGMVVFNVIENSPFELYQATSGAIIVGEGLPEAFIEAMKKTQLEFICTLNIEGYKWSKLLLNLNNAVNALSGLPIKAELSNRRFRLIYASAMEEALKIIKRKDIQLEKLSPVPFSFIPYILRLPTWLFQVVAKKMIDIDPTAKSSMLIDFEKGRPTEVDFLNGVVVKEGRKLNVPTPVNVMITDFIHRRKKLTAADDLQDP